MVTGERAGRALREGLGVFHPRVWPKVLLPLLGALAVTGLAFAVFMQRGWPKVVAQGDYAALQARADSNQAARATAEAGRAVAMVQASTAEGKLKMLEAAATGAEPSPSPVSAQHWARLEKLNEVYRSQGLEPWLRAAGLSWDSLTVDARQIEEETSPSGSILASGVQVNVQNLRVDWPNIVVTDTPERTTATADTVQHKPDQRNASTLYTNVTANGPVTVWTSGLNWGQFTSRLGPPGS